MWNDLVTHLRIPHWITGISQQSVNSSDSCCLEKTRDDGEASSLGDNHCAPPDENRSRLEGSYSGCSPKEPPKCPSRNSTKAGGTNTAPISPSNPNSSNNDVQPPPGLLSACTTARAYATTEAEGAAVSRTTKNVQKEASAVTTDLSGGSAASSSSAYRQDNGPN